MSDQLEFTELVQQAEISERTVRDAHLLKVQHWFDGLPRSDKEKLALLVLSREYETWVALAAAAGDFFRSKMKGRRR